MKSAWSLIEGLSQKDEDWVVLIDFGQRERQTDGQSDTLSSYRSQKYIAQNTYNETNCFCTIGKEKKSNILFQIMNSFKIVPILRCEITKIKKNNVNICF